MEIEKIKLIKSKIYELYIDDEELKNDIDELEKLLLIYNCKKGSKHLLKKMFPSSSKLNNEEQKLHYKGLKRGRKPKKILNDIIKPKIEVLIERNIVIEV